MFFILEGIDGAGCGAQRKNLEKKLKEKDLRVLTMKYPYYETSIGEILRQFLKEDKKLSVEMQFLLFAGQMVAEKERIKEQRVNNIIICDHYFAATLVYQGMYGFDYQKGLQFAKDFQLEIPDLTFFLDTPLEIARQRKQGEEGKIKLDRHERDLEISKKIDKGYRSFVENQTFCKWQVIDNTKTIDEVSQDIINIIRNFKV